MKKKIIKVIIVLVVAITLLGVGIASYVHASIIDPYDNHQNELELVYDSFTKANKLTKIDYISQYNSDKVYYIAHCIEQGEKKLFVFDKEYQILTSIKLEKIDFSLFSESLLNDRAIVADNEEVGYGYENGQLVYVYRKVTDNKILYIYYKYASNEFLKLYEFNK